METALEEKCEEFIEEVISECVKEIKFYGFRKLFDITRYFCKNCGVESENFKKILDYTQCTD